MPFTVNGTAQERATIQAWQRQICSNVIVDPDSGEVSMAAGPPGPNARTSGCDCLQQLMEGGRTVTIQPLPSQKSVVPHVGVLIGDMGGAVTIAPFPDAQSPQPDGSPGQGPDGNVGSDPQVFIDMSNNGGRGYNGDPLWLILAHELTSGHAFHISLGTHPPTRREAENTAIESENIHRAEHGLPERPLIPPDTEPGGSGGGDSGSGGGDSGSGGGDSGSGGSGSGSGNGGWW